MLCEPVTVRTSLASIERAGYVNLCRCHQFRRLKSESNWVTVSLSRYDDNSDIAAAVDDIDVGVGVGIVDWDDTVAGHSLHTSTGPVPQRRARHQPNQSATFTINRTKDRIRDESMMHGRRHQT